MAEFRIEHDLLGDYKVPVDAYYGVQTARAIDNFRISNIPISQYPSLIKALAIVKLGAARANRDLGRLSDEVFGPMEQACQEIMDGQLHEHFPVDCFQGGAGTSTNMNVNEVIANRALEIMGKERADYQFCHPNDHVNLSQSTNDVYPSALHIAIAFQNKKLAETLDQLVNAFVAKGEEFKSILKMGRTQLQDAVPMTLGQEFAAWGKSLAQEVATLRSVEKVLHEVNMGGTAIGTGLNAAPGFAEKCAAHLADITGLDIYSAEDLVEATQDTQSFVVYSGILKSLAIKLSKICNDLRLLSSGPRTGFNEINLPAMQPGSSIMPGKVNPVIPELVNQVCFRVLGNDLVVSMAAEAGQLQLNVMEPVIAVTLLEGQVMLSNASVSLTENCVKGITANESVCQQHIESSIGVVTALNPVLGYKASTKIAAQALATGKGVVELVREQNLLTEEQIAKYLDPQRMANPFLEDSSSSD